MVIIAAAFLLGAALALAGAGAFVVRAVRRVEAVASRLAQLAADNRSVSDPKPEPGPLTTDNLEPEDQAEIKKRQRRGYFA